MSTQPRSLAFPYRFFFAAVAKIVAAIIFAYGDFPQQLCVCIWECVCVCVGGGGGGGVGGGRGEWG